MSSEESDEWDLHSVFRRASTNHPEGDISPASAKPHCPAHPEYSSGVVVKQQVRKPITSEKGWPDSSQAKRPKDLFFER